MQAKKKAILALAAIFSGSALSLTVAEVALRIAGWRTPALYKNGVPMSHAIPDHTSEADQSGDFVLYHWDFEVPWTLNSDGFRDSPRAPKHDSIWRVGLFGDSVCAGFGVRLEERFSDIFEKSRMANGDQELINFGVPGTGLHAQVDFIAGYSELYDLDEIVVAVFGGNELEDNKRWEQIREHDSSSSVSTRPAWSLRNWLMQNSRVAAIAWVNGGRLLFERVAPAEFSTDSQMDTLWEPTERALGRLRDLGSDRNITLWYIPSEIEWNDELWRRASASTEVPEERRWYVRKRFLDWADKHGVKIIDTTPALLGLPVNRAKFPIDGHFNAEGNRIIAESILSQDEAVSGPRGR